MTAHETAGLVETRAELADVEAQLAQLGHKEAALQHRRSMQELHDRLEHRLQTLTSAYAAAMSLARLSSPSEILLKAPTELAGAAGFERVLLSTIDGDLLLPLAAHFSTSRDPEIDADLVVDALARLRDSPVRLAHNLIESDAVRRRRPALVTDAERNPRAAARIHETMGWSGYVIAPIFSGPVTIGLVHADRGPNAALDVLDRDALGEFASVVSQIHESAELRRTLRQEREAVRRFLDRLAALSTSLADTPVTLSGEEAKTRPATSPISISDARPGGLAEDDRFVFSGLLTKRELEVLRLLVDGGSNRSIADALVVSDATVKFHVNSILRKLHVANRAEAVSRYLTLSGVPTSGPPWAYEATGRPGVKKVVEASRESRPASARPSIASSATWEER